MGAVSSSTVILTGASRGLGAAAARQLARDRANIVLNARNEQALAAVAAEVEELGGQALAIAGDVSQPNVCQRLIEQAIAAFGHIDAVINNAAVLDPIAPIAESDPAAWRRHIEINLFGPYLLSRAAIPHLRKTRGRIINVSSGAAEYVIAGWSAYCASKAALDQLTRSLAVEEPLITAIAMRPGKVDTSMQALIREVGSKGMTPQEHRMFVEFHRRGELLPPELPARSLAALALAAPPEWSGRVLRWNEVRLRNDGTIASASRYDADKKKRR